MQLTIGSRRLHCTWKRCFSIYVNDFIDCLIYWRLVTNCFVGRLQIARDGSGGGGAGLGPSLLLSLITFHCNRHHSVVWLSRESKKRACWLRPALRRPLFRRTKRDWEACRTRSKFEFCRLKGRWFSLLLKHSFELVPLAIHLNVYDGFPRAAYTLRNQTF